MNSLPIYESTVLDMAWSPDQLSAPFDLDAHIVRSYEQHAPCYLSGKYPVQDTVPAPRRPVPAKKGAKR